MSIVEINNLVKKYGDNVAVNDLSLNIDSKGVYGFLGPNGAGKSTTMNILTGYIGVTSGTVKINGYDIFKEPEEAKKNVGYLPEIPPLYQDMTVYEYLEFVSKIKKIKKEERKKCIEQSLEMTRTTQVRERLIKNLSKGYKQRVGIAQAIMGMPDLIILDEPTVGLDPKQIIEIRDLIRSLGKEHTVILSSHILTEISEVCENIFIISQGKLVASGKEEELIEELAGENRIEAIVKGDVKEIETILDEFGCKHSIEVMDDEKCKIQIVTSREIDIREGLFFALAEKRLPLLELKFKTKSLEDIFIELTTEYKAQPKKKSHKFKKKQIEKGTDDLNDSEKETDDLNDSEKEVDDVNNSEQPADDVKNVEKEAQEVEE